MCTPAQPSLMISGEVSLRCSDRYVHCDFYARTECTECRGKDDDLIRVRYILRANATDQLHKIGAASEMTVRVPYMISRLNQLCYAMKLVSTAELLWVPLCKSDVFPAIQWQLISSPQYHDETILLSYSKFWADFNGCKDANSHALYGAPPCLFKLCISLSNWFE